MIPFFEELDHAIAASLEVDVEEYIKKIEYTDYNTASKIIHGVLSEDDQQLQEAKELFATIKLS